MSVFRQITGLLYVTAYTFRHLFTSQLYDRGLAELIECEVWATGHSKSTAKASYVSEHVAQTNSMKAHRAYLDFINLPEDNNAVEPRNMMPSSSKAQQQLDQQLMDEQNTELEKDVMEVQAEIDGMEVARANRTITQHVKLNLLKFIITHALAIMHVLNMMRTFWIYSFDQYEIPTN